MKKKIINGFLMVAFLAATSASFVSCKDNDEDVKYDLLNELRGDITPVQTAITNAQTDATKAIADAAAAATAANNANTKAQQALDWINAQDLSVYMKKEDFKDSIAHYLQDWALESTVASRFSDVWAELQKQEAKIKADSIKIDSLAGVTTSIQTDVENIKSDIATIKEDVAKVKYQISTIITALENMITSVTVNATSTSLLPNSKIIPGLNAQLLGTAFGIVKADVTFPAADDVISASDIKDAITINKGYTNSEAGNAGTVYFTVNPSNIDASLVKMSLINSKGEKKYVELGAIEPADDVVLKWGGLSTRADNPVTLWKSNATIDLEETPEVSLNKVINFEKIAGNIKQMINEAQKIEGNKASIKSTGKALIKDAASLVANLANVTIPELPALALKAEWNDTVGTRSVISDYSIAATAYRPLAFNAFDGLVSPTKINLKKLDEIVERVVNTIKKEVNNIDLSSLDKIEVETPKGLNLAVNENVKVYYHLETKTVSIEGAGSDDVQVLTEIKLVQNDSWTPETTLAPGKDTADGWYNGGSFKVTANFKKDIEKIITAVNDGIDLSSITSQVETLKKNINGYADKIQNLSESVINYLDIYVNKVISFVSAARFMEPILLVQNGNGIARTVGKFQAGKHNFIPTTLNAEILAPVYKKYVAVVKDGQIQESYITSKGDKNFNTIELNLEKGVNTIVYSALDFNGNQISKKYTITVE
jgi:hypothetical protein